jgi:hypothetical protein
MPWCQGRRWTSLEGGNRGLRSESAAEVLWGFDGGCLVAQRGSRWGRARVALRAAGRIETSPLRAGALIAQGSSAWTGLETQPPGYLVPSWP